MAKFLFAAILALPTLSACDSSHPPELVAPPFALPRPANGALQTTGDILAKSYPDGSVLLTEFFMGGGDADNSEGAKYPPLPREKPAKSYVLGVCASTGAVQIVDSPLWLEHPEYEAFGPQPNIPGPPGIVKTERVGKARRFVVGGKRLETKGQDVVEFCISPRGDAIATVSSDSIQYTPFSLLGGAGAEWAGPFHVEVFRVSDGARLGGPVRLGGEHVGPVWSMECVWSPDSRWVYVYDPFLRMDLWMMHADDAKVLTPVQPAKSAAQDCWDRPAKAP